MSNCRPGRWSFGESGDLSLLMKTALGKVVLLLFGLGALQALTGSDRLDAGPMLDYFAPLQTWLDEQNQGRTCGW